MATLKLPTITYFNFNSIPVKHFDSIIVIGNYFVNDYFVVVDCFVIDCIDYFTVITNYYFIDYSVVDYFVDDYFVVSYYIADFNLSFKCFLMSLDVVVIFVVTLTFEPYYFVFIFT